MALRPGACPANARNATPGFTLIELLVVVALIAVLISLLLPGLARAKEAAKSAVCLTRLHNLQVSLRIYADDHRTLPVDIPCMGLMPMDLPPQTFECPSDDNNAERTPTTLYTSYTYVAPIYMDPPDGNFVLSQLKPWIALRRYEANPRLPLFWDAREWHSACRNVVYWAGDAARKDW